MCTITFFILSHALSFFISILEEVTKTLYNHTEPMSTRLEALKMEEKLTFELRRQRYSVWFN